MTDQSAETSLPKTGAPKTSQLPLDAWHRSKDARMVPFAGYDMPIQYAGPFGGIVAEHEWTRTHAGLFDVSHMGQLMVAGKGAAKALEVLVPGAIASLKPGRVRYSLLLNKDGGIIDDLMITNATPWIGADEIGGPDGCWGPPTYYLVVNGATKWGDIAHLQEHLTEALSPIHLVDQALIALQGPEAAIALDRIIPGIADDLAFMQSKTHQFGEWPLRITRAGYTGEDGFEISIPAEFVSELADLLCAQDEVRPVGLGARDSLRLEAGLPLYGHDMDQTIDPVSADLTFALTKKRRESGGWMGFNAVKKMLATGPEQKRVGLKLDGRLPAREGAEVFIGEHKVGTVTSGGHSPTLGYPIAMANVASICANEGSELEIEVRKKRILATIVPMPFVPHRYFRGR